MVWFGFICVGLVSPWACAGEPVSNTIKNVVQSELCDTLLAMALRIILKIPPKPPLTQSQTSRRVCETDKLQRGLETVT
eukprot:4092827-Amphidinium_carterae.1